MIKEAIKNSVIDLLSELFSNMNLDKNIMEYIDLVDDAGMDSITFISLIIELETMFKITVPDELLLIENFKNVNNIINIIQAELNKAEGLNDDEN